MNDIKDIDDIKALKKENKNRPPLSKADREALRRKVEKIIVRNEEEERKKKAEEMERLYGFNMYA